MRKLNVFWLIIASGLMANPLGATGENEQQQVSNNNFFMYVSNGLDQDVWINGGPGTAYNCDDCPDWQNQKIDKMYGDIMYTVDGRISWDNPSSGQAGWAINTGDQKNAADNVLYILLHRKKASGKRPGGGPNQVCIMGQFLFSNSTIDWSYTCVNVEVHNKNYCAKIVNSGGDLYIAASKAGDAEARYPGVQVMGRLVCPMALCGRWLPLMDQGPIWTGCGPA